MLELSLLVAKTGLFSLEWISFSDLSFQRNRFSDELTSFGCGISFDLESNHDNGEAGSTNGVSARHLWGVSSCEFNLKENTDFTTEALRHRV